MRLSIIYELLALASRTLVCEAIFKFPTTILSSMLDNPVVRSCHVATKVLGSILNAGSG